MVWGTLAPYMWGLELQLETFIVIVWSICADLSQTPPNGLVSPGESCEQFHRARMPGLIAAT